MARMKTNSIPFLYKVQKGDKFDYYMHKPYESHVTKPPSPKMGAMINKKYDQWMSDYYKKHEQLHWRREAEIISKSRMAQEQVKVNRMFYQNMKLKAPPVQQIEPIKPL